MVLDRIRERIRNSGGLGIIETLIIVALAALVVIFAAKAVK